VPSGRTCSKPPFTSDGKLEGSSSVSGVGTAAAGGRGVGDGAGVARGEGVGIAVAPGVGVGQATGVAAGSGENWRLETDTARVSSTAMTPKRAERAAQGASALSTRHCSLLRRQGSAVEGLSTSDEDPKPFGSLYHTTRNEMNRRPGAVTVKQASRR